MAQKIVMFAQQSKHELCVLSASGTISTASLRQPGGNISYEVIFLPKGLMNLLSFSLIFFVLCAREELSQVFFI